MSDEVEFLKRVYAFFSGREIVSALAATHPEVVLQTDVMRYAATGNVGTSQQIERSIRERRL